MPKPSSELRERRPSPGGANEQSYTRAGVLVGSSERLELLELQEALRAEGDVRSLGPRVLR